MNISDFDPFSQSYRNDPKSHHAWLLGRSPGFMMMEGVPSAFVATYAHNAAVLRDFKTFSSSKPDGLPGMERLDFFNGLPVMNYSDPPDHIRRRKVVNPAFTPKRAALLLEQAESTIDRLLDEIAAESHFDVVSQLTKPLAIDVLLRKFLGVADEDHYIFMNYVSTLRLLDGLKPGQPKPQPYLDAWTEGADYCRRQLDLAKQGKCNSLIGVIANSADQGAISESEMMAMMIVLLIGGVTTVASVASSSLLNLARYPAVAKQIREDLSLSVAHMEESLRLDPPVSLVLRFTTTDWECSGVVVPKGTPMYAMVSVACSDPKIFTDPYRFQLHRGNSKDHMAFGQGIHTCIGSSLTRNIVPLLIRKAVERLPNLRLENEASIKYDTTMARQRHLTELVLAT